MIATLHVHFSAAGIRTMHNHPRRMSLLCVPDPGVTIPASLRLGTRIVVNRPLSVYQSLNNDKEKIKVS
jgi:hypothetical protein